MRSTFSVVVPQFRYFPGYSHSALALQRLFVLLCCFVSMTSTSLRGNIVDLYHHNCGQFCDQYTGQDYAGLSLHTDVTASFPPGDYDVEINHPEGRLEKVYIEYFNGTLYGADAAIWTYSADDLGPGGQRVLSPTGRVFIHGTNTLANVFMVDSEEGVLRSGVACDCGLHADLPPAV
jgi:hypothetical protein